MRNHYRIRFGSKIQYPTFVNFLEALEMCREDKPLYEWEISNNILSAIPADVIRIATREAHPRMMCGSEFFEEIHITGGNLGFNPMISRSTTPESGMGSMPALVDASRARCTLGEQVQAMADVFGRYSGGPEW